MPRKGRAHRSKSPDSREQSESSHTKSEASDAESSGESSGEATPANRRMNPAVDIKVTTEVRHAKASKSGLTVTTTTTPGKLSFYHSTSFWATEIKEARRIMKTTPPYKCTGTHISKNVLPNKRRKRHKYLDKSGSAQAKQIRPSPNGRQHRTLQHQDFI